MSEGGVVRVVFPASKAIGADFAVALGDCVDGFFAETKRSEFVAVDFDLDKAAAGEHTELKGQSVLDAGLVASFGNAIEVFAFEWGSTSVYFDETLVVGEIVMKAGNNGWNVIERNMFIGGDDVEGDDAGHGWSLANERVCPWGVIDVCFDLSIAIR